LNKFSIRPLSSPCFIKIQMYRELPVRENYPYEVKDNTKLIVIVVIICIVTFLILGTIGLVLISQGKFGTNVNTTLKPLYNTTSITMNEFNNRFEPNNIYENEFNNGVNITNNFQFNINCNITQ